MQRTAGGMGRVVWLFVAISLCAGIAPGVASSSPVFSLPDPQAGNSLSLQTGDPFAPLRNAELVVWVLQPAAGPPPAESTASAADRIASADAAAAAAPRLNTAHPYTEQNSGSFGQPASSFGVDSGNYGVPSSSSVISAPPSGTGYHQQTSGSFGDSSGNFGTSASNYGQEANSTGQTAGSFGAQSNSVGQTAGSFGNSLGTVATAGIHNNVSPARSLSPEQTRQMEQLEQDVRSAFPDLHVHYVSVDPRGVQADLTSVQGSTRYPDLLVARSPAGWWPEIEREFAAANLQPAVFYADGVTSHAAPEAETALLPQAPHRAAAQAFALWMSEAGSGCAGCLLQNPTPSAQAAAKAAGSAIRRLLGGQSLGDEADPEMAAIPPQSGPAMLSLSSGPLRSDTPIRVEAMRASANGRLAAVALRVIASAPNIFAVAHPLVVLRRAADGRWRVLHVSLDLPPSQQQGERETLMNSISVAAERPSLLRGVTQASPANGGISPPQPQLWWDNGGGASLQVVEWQMRRDGDWASPYLYLAPDSGARLRTEVTARFAASPASYRWRVWSVGYHGQTRISPWSTFTVSP